MLLDVLTSSLTDTAIHIGIIVLLAVAARWLVHVAIGRIVKAATNRTHSRLDRFGRTGQILAQATGLESERQAARARTIGSMLSSTATVVIVAVALLTALGDVGINVTPVLTTAGVGGVALAFGAQSLVKDVLSGVFLVVEDQYGVGDTVTIGDVTGTVEEVSLRVTSIRDGDGKLWFLRNGEITKVANVSQGWSMATVDVLVAPDADLSRASQVLSRVCAQMFTDDEFADQLAEEPKLLGVDKITAEAMTLQLSAKCLANQQWGVKRTLLARAKQALDAAGIPGPRVGWKPQD